MKKIFGNLRDTFIAGLIFLLPLLIIIVLAAKVFQFLAGFSTKIAKMFGLNSILGVSGGTIISGIFLIVVCLLFGYLTRISFFKSINRWANKKLADNIPGYAFYRDQALASLDPKEEVLPIKMLHSLTQTMFKRPVL